MARREPAGLLLGLAALLLGGSVCSAPAGIHSLCLNFTVKSWVQPGEPWCKVHGSVDQVLVSQYDSVTNKAMPFHVLGKEVTATKEWTTLTDEMRSVGQEIRDLLSDMLVTNKTKGHPTLEAKMFCQCDKEQCLEASWLFSIDGQRPLKFDAMSSNWTANHSGDREIKEKWENDRDLGNHLIKVSRGDCKDWIQELLNHLQEIPVSTSEAPHTSQSPVSSSNNQQNRLDKVGGVGRLISIISALALVVIVIVIYITSRKRECSMKDCLFYCDKQSFQNENSLSSPQSNGPTDLHLEPLNP